MSQTSSIHLAIGPMFSGKSEWLIDNLEKEKQSEKQILPIRYSRDTRYSNTEIVCHNGKKMKALSAQTSQDIFQLMKDHPSTLVIGIDEMQFYDEQLVDVCKVIKENGILVYVSGLDLDFKKDFWETTREIMKIADSITRLSAICSVCSQRNAIYTQRLIQDASQVLIGGDDLYTARCELHYENIV